MPWFHSQLRELRGPELGAMTDADLLDHLSRARTHRRYPDALDALSLQGVVRETRATVD